MPRKAIIAFPIACIICILISTIIIGTMPLWFPILMINPKIISPITGYITARFMRHAAKMMFAAPRKVPMM